MHQSVSNFEFRVVWLISILVFLFFDYRLKKLKISKEIFQIVRCPKRQTLFRVFLNQFFFIKLQVYVILHIDYEFKKKIKKLKKYIFFKKDMIFLYILGLQCFFLNQKKLFSSKFCRELKNLQYVELNFVIERKIKVLKIF